jgi:PTS system fructose-specific IIC component
VFMFIASIAVGVVITALVLLALKRWAVRKPVEAEPVPAVIAA